MESILPPPVELAPSERLFGFPVKKFIKRLNATENRVLCLTAENICVCEGAIITSIHPLKSIYSVAIFADDDTKFKISYHNSTKSSPSLFYCDERDIILANLMNICGSTEGPIFDLSGTENIYHLPGSCTFSPDADVEEYFLRKLAKTTANSPDLTSNLKEFLFYIPQSYQLQVKDRRGISHMFEMLHFFNDKFEKGNEQCSPVIIDILSVIQRLLCSKINFQELRAVKNAAHIFSDLLRSQDDRIVSATALTLLRVIEIPKAFGKENKLEVQNKSYFLSTEDKVSPILNALLSTLIQHAGESVSSQDRRHILSISCLLDILVSQLSTHKNTTDKNWFRDVIVKMSRGRVMITLFELARSNCFAIALKTTIILKVIFTQITAEQLLSVQDTARQQLSLLYQIFQSVNSRLKQQRNESAELVGLMCEGNQESMNLIRRIFPVGIVNSLESTAEKQQRKVGRGRLLKSSQQSSGGGGSSSDLTANKLKLNWVGLFKAISKDFRTPTVLWNADTRNEVISAISGEIDRYERDKENNQDTNKIWNHEEFSVEYETLNRELIIFDTYLGVILEQPDQMISISEPASYLYQCFHKLIMEDNEENKIRYLNVMAWCYKYNVEQIGPVTCLPNLVQLLNDYNTQQSHGAAGGVLEFFKASFKDRRNIRKFIDLNGVCIAAELLKDSLCPNNQSITFLLNVLLTATSYVSSTDERGYIKIPIPKAKRDLSNAKCLTRLVYTLCSSDNLVVAHAAHLLSQVLDKNSGKAKTLHKHTGILFFIFAYTNTHAEVALMKLLQILSSQQDPHLLRKFIPDSVASYLYSVDSEQFANAFYCKTNVPEIIWTKTMLDILQNTVQNHIQGFINKIKEDPYATYEYQEMESIEYPGLDQELRCGNYYIRNVIENPEWNIEDVEDVLRDALELIPNVDKENQILLIRACSVLFKKKRYRKKDAIKKFEGFPLILRLVHLDRDRADLSAENIELLNVSCELIFYSVWTSDDNLTNFLKLKGLSRLCNLLWCCSRHVDQCYSIITFVLKIVCRLLPSPITRDQVALNTDIIRDILSCMLVGQPFEIVSLAMQCLIELSQEDRLSHAVFKNGGHFYLLDFILSFSIQQTNESLGGSSNEEEQLNQLAVSACLVLGTMSGIYKTHNEPLTTTEEKLQHTLSQLLTKGNLERMRSQSELNFVVQLCSSYESPVSIWNESTRNELASFIRTRIQAHQHSQQEEPDELSFTFEAHKQELQIDGIFLRYYIQQPSWKLSNPRQFVTKLLSEIQSIQSSSSSSSSSSNNIETLTIILQSLYFVLTETQGLEKLIVSSDALDQFFMILSSSSTALQSLILSIFLHATANQSCVDAICASNRLHQFVGFLRNGELEQRKILLEVISNMVSCSSRAVEGITTSGLILYLLSYVISSPNEDEQLCAQSLGVLKQTKSSSGLDTRFLDVTKLFLPNYLVALLDRPANFLHVFSKDTKSPNLIWDSTHRSAVQQKVQSILSSFQSSGSIEWNYSQYANDGINFSNLSGQSIIGGVYLDIYIENPNTRLHNPACFIDDCFSHFTSSNDYDLQCKLIIALSSLLGYYSAWAHYIGQKIQPPQLQSFLAFFNPSNTSSSSSSFSNEQIHSSFLKIIAILSNVAVARKKFLQSSIISQLFNLLEIHSNFDEVIMKTIYLLVKKEPNFIKQILDYQCLPLILQIVDKRSSASKFAVAIIRSLVVNRTYDAQVRQLLAGREQILKDNSRLPNPEWVTISPLTAAVQVPYFEPVEADGRSQQMASLQRSATSVTIPQVSTTATSTNNQAPTKMAPLQRATTQPVIRNNTSPPPVTPNQSVATSSDDLGVHLPQQPSQDTTHAVPSEPTSTGGEKPLPVPPSKPAELRKPQTTVVPPAVPDQSAPVPPVTGPPPPPPAAPTVKSLPPKSAGRGALLDSIVKGKQLKHVEPPSEEERKNRRNTATPSAAGGSSSGGGDNLMNALAGALAKRRTALVTNLAANPFADEKDDDESEEWD